MIIKNGLVWEESGSFLTKDLHIDSDTHRIAMDSAERQMTPLLMHPVCM